MKMIEIKPDLSIFNREVGIMEDKVKDKGEEIMRKSMKKGRVIIIRGEEISKEQMISLIIKRTVMIGLIIIDRKIEDITPEMKGMKEM